MSRKTVITGINGFVGNYLAQFLSSKGFEIFGIDIGATCSIELSDYFQMDIRDSNQMAALIQKINPEHIYHLAAISFPPDMEKSPTEALDINVRGPIAMFDAIRKVSPPTRLLMVGSSKQYGPDAVSPINEQCTQSPDSFYGTSKLAAELLGKQFIQQYNVDIRFTRSFNHTGPGQSPQFVCSDWAKQAAEIELGLRSPDIITGNLDELLDFTDVRDIVRAYYLILERGRRGETYNVCSSREITLKEVLRILTSKVSKPIKIVQDAQKTRGRKTKKIIGDNSKIQHQTAWTPLIPIEQTLDDLYNYWISKLTQTS